jgi:SAM-dependent methyltransferase
MASDWNAGLYDASHGFVWAFGRDLLGMLDAQAGERILDIGCGTGHLMAEIAAAGARVTGVDRSPAMIAQARATFPALEFDVRDACALEFDAQFDAVFSNAALHWVKAAEDAAAGMARALKPRGRIVIEMGGRGNVAVLVEGAYRALRRLGVARPELENPWYFPGVAEYAGLLERHGIEVTFATLFDRPTPLEEGDGGLDAWFRMFGSTLTAPLADADRAEFVRLVAEYCRPKLWNGERWTADYRRLRIAGRKKVGTETPAGT